METIREQGHGAGDVTGSNFGNHHDNRQRYHPKGALGVLIMG